MEDNIEKTEYQQAWDERIRDIEVAISESLMHGVTPKILLASGLTIEQLCKYLDLEPDWKNPDGRAIAFGDEGEIILMLYRSVDVPYGNIIIR